MKEHYILLSLKAPDFSDGKYKLAEWKKCVMDEVSTKKMPKKTEMLARNDTEIAWLIPRDSGLSFLAECIYRTESYGGTFKSWFLDESEQPQEAAPLNHGSKTAR